MVDIARNEPSDHDWANVKMAVRRTQYPQGIVFEITKTLNKDGRDYIRSVVITRGELRDLARDFSELPPSVTRTHG